MKIIEGKIHNEIGLTSRLAALLVGEANHFKSNLTIKVFDETADLKSIMNVMALVIPDCTPYTITIDGVDEELAFESLSATLKEKDLL